MKKTASDVGMVNISSRIPKSLVKIIKTKALSEHRTFSSMLRVILEESLKKV